MPSYWPRAREWANTNTNLYSPKKAIPSVITMLANWWWLTDRQIGFQIVASVSILISAYLVLFGLEYMWNLLVRAPTHLCSPSFTLANNAERDHRRAQIAQWRNMISEIHRAWYAICEGYDEPDTKDTWKTLIGRIEEHPAFPSLRPHLGEVAKGKFYGVKPIAVSPWTTMDWKLHVLLEEIERLEREWLTDQPGSKST